MKRSIKHLPKEKQQELQEIVVFLTKHITTEMIILFGSYARGDWVEDKYVENGTTYEYKSDYDLLIVVDNETKAHHNNRFASKLKRKITRNTGIEMLVNVIYHGIDYLNSEIENGNYFFTDILKEGRRLYHSRKYVLSKPKSLSVKARINKAELYFKQWFENASVFFEDYEANFQKRNKGQVYLNKAAFELHQATERYFMTILLVLTDYKPKIHDLEELDIMVSKLDARLKTVFPRKTEKQERLFILLKKAYIDARYKMEYSVKKEELEYLSERIEKLKILTEKICAEKIKQLKSEI